MEHAEQDIWPRTTRRRRRSSNPRIDSAFTSSTDVPEISGVGRLDATSGGDRVRISDHAHSRTRTPSPSSTASRRSRLYLSPVRRKTSRLPWAGSDDDSDGRLHDGSSQQQAIVINKESSLSISESQQQQQQQHQHRNTFYGRRPSEVTNDRSNSIVSQLGDDLNPMAIAVGGMVTRSLSAISPVSVCSTFSLLYFCVAILSLFISVTYSAARADTSGGFAIGAYVVAIGAMLIMPTQSRHQQRCSCASDMDWSQRSSIEDSRYPKDDQQELPVTASQHSRGLRMLRQRLDELSDEVWSLRRNQQQQQQQQHRRRYESHSEYQIYDSAYAKAERNRNRPPSVVIAPLPLEEPALPSPAANSSMNIARRSRSRSGGILKTSRSAAGAASSAPDGNPQTTIATKKQEEGQEKGNREVEDRLHGGSTSGYVTGSVPESDRGDQQQQQRQNEKQKQLEGTPVEKQQEKQENGDEEKAGQSSGHQLLRLGRADSGKDEFEEIKGEGSI